MTLQLVLLVAAALFAVGLYGAISQQVVVMVMMGLELMVNGVILAAGRAVVVPRPGPDRAGAAARGARGDDRRDGHGLRRRHPAAPPGAAADMTDMATELHG